MPRAALTLADAGSSRLSRLATRLAAINEEKKSLDAQADDLKKKLLAELERVGEPDAEGKVRAETDTHRLVIVNGSSSKLDSVKLLALGVAPRVLKKATVVTEYAYVKLTAKKDGEE